MTKVKRYYPSEVLTDRWEMGSMDEHKHGQYVEWDDYEELLLKLETMTADRDAEKAMKAQARMERDNMTARNKILRERPDLPVDRIPAMLRLERLQGANTVLHDALVKLSSELVAAGATVPQPYHSWNEKQAFGIMTRMGQHGMEAVARSMME